MQIVEFFSRLDLQSKRPLESHCTILFSRQFIEFWNFRYLGLG